MQTIEIPYFNLYRDAKYHCIIKICIACQITRIDIFQKIMHLMDNQKSIFIEVTENFFYEVSGYKNV